MPRAVYPLLLTGALALVAQAADEYSGALQLAHVFKDHDDHVLCPVRDP